MAEKKRSGLVQVVANLQGPSRTEELMGSEYVVISAVLVKSQVLNNNLGATYLPEEVFTPAWAEAANLAPVLVGPHPTKRGKHVSAKAPDVLNARGAGFLFRVEAEDAQLVADVFLDPSRVGEVEGLEAVLERVENEEVVELSTGFPVQIEEEAGAANGEDYELVIYPLGFDHLVVFHDDAVGACSVDDGCGLGANEEQEVIVENAGDSFPWLARLMSWAKGLMAHDAAQNESDEDRRRLLQTELNQAFGGEDYSIWVEAVFSEEGQVVYEVYGDGDKVGLYQVTFELDASGQATLGEPFEVRRVTTFEPVPDAAEEAQNLAVGNAGHDEEDHPNREEDTVMIDRQALLSRLSGDCQQRLAVYEKLEDEELAVLASGLNDADPPQGAEPTDGGDPVSPEGEVAETADETPDPVTELKSMVEELGAKVSGLQQAVQPAMEEQATQRAALVEELAGNNRVPFEKPELEAKSMEELRKLQAMARGTNYSLRGGPATPEPTANEAFVPHQPYWAEQEQTQKQAGEVN